MKKYAGPSVNDQLRTLARDAAYDDKPLDLIAAADEVGRALSGVERQMAQAYYRTCRSEMQVDQDRFWLSLREDEQGALSVSDSYEDEQDTLSLSDSLHNALDDYEGWVP